MQPRLWTKGQKTHTSQVNVNSLLPSYLQWLLFYQFIILVWYLKGFGWSYWHKICIVRPCLTCINSMAVLHRIACAVTWMPQVSVDHFKSSMWHHPPSLHQGRTGRWSKWVNTSMLQCMFALGLHSHCEWWRQRGGWLKSDGRGWWRVRWSTWLPFFQVGCWLLVRPTKYLTGLNSCLWLSLAGCRCSKGAFWI